jgi:hypothetical protein
MISFLHIGNGFLFIYTEIMQVKAKKFQDRIGKPIGKLSIGFLRSLFTVLKTYGK